MTSKKRVFGPEVAVLGSARIEPPDARWDQAHALGGLLAAGGFTVVTGLPQAFGMRIVALRPRRLG